MVLSSARSNLAPPNIPIDEYLPLHGRRYLKAIFAVYGWVLPNQRNCAIFIVLEHQKMPEDCGPSGAVERRDFDFPPLTHLGSMEKSLAKSKWAWAQWGAESFEVQGAISRRPRSL